MEKGCRKWGRGGIGFCVVFSVLRPVFADPPTNLNAADLATRFEKLEARIVELQGQLADQDKKHQAEIETLRRQIEIKGPQEKSVYLPSAPQAGPKWLEGLQMGGDLRLRYEAFDQNEATRDRNRFRYRLRWRITQQLSRDLDLGFRIVSGSATDPTSALQTLTGDFTFKSIFIDQAYVKYRLSFLMEHVPHLDQAEIGGGKVENPFFENSGGLLWDGDVMPEGFYESLAFEFFDQRLKPFVNLGQFVLQESAASSDAELYGVQAGVRWNPPGFGKDSEVQLTHALGYFDYSDYARSSNFLVSGVSLARGNTVAGSGTALASGDFNILQIYNDLKFKVGDLPVKLFSDVFTNVADQTPDPDDRSFGYQYGIQLGKAKKKGEWEALYFYGYVEPNAAVGAFTDSDFGAGHANKRGSAVKLGYKLTDSMRLGLTGYFVNNITGADDETRRFQTDLEWVF